MSKSEPALERWMWVYLESGFRPEWAHKGIDHQDLRDMIAKAIKHALQARESDDG